MLFISISESKKKCMLIMLNLVGIFLFVVLTQLLRFVFSLNLCPNQNETLLSAVQSIRKGLKCERMVTF